MVDIAKTTHKGLGLPKHFDPSMEQMKKNMEVIDDILQKAVPNDLTSTSEGESSIDALVTTGRYLVKASATGYPVFGCAGIVDVFKAGTYILQEWRSIDTHRYEYRRYSDNSGSSWSSWTKMWNAINDGSGSGLDADLLDGFDSSHFFQIRGTIANFNSATTEGKWRITSGNNAPYTSCTDWICIVYHLSGTTSELYQVAYEETSNVPTNISGGSTANYSNMPLMFIRKRINSTTWSSWQVVWHSGIDGAGSGLDADKLDGKHSNELPYVPVTISTSGSYNIDSYQTEGFYSFATITSAKTLPTWSVSGGGYGLIVKDARGNGGCHQLLFRDGNSEIYIRNNHSSAWSDWVHIGGTANDILTKLKTVDGTGSGLDADLLDGAEGSSYLKIANLLTELKKVGGSGSGLDADLLDGHHASAFAKSSIISVDATSGSKSLMLTLDNSNTEWRYTYASGITSLTLATGAFSSDVEAYYSIVFKSGTTATTIVNSLGAYFTGDDCVDGIFTPSAVKTYDVGIWWNGMSWQAVVRGV